MADRFVVTVDAEFVRSNPLGTAQTLSGLVGDWLDFFDHDELPGIDHSPRPEITWRREIDQ